MTITTFSSKPVFRLYRNILRRNLGLCLFYTALSFFFFPLQYILQLITTPEQELADISLLGPGQAFTAIAAIFYTGMMALFPILLASVLLNYLYSRSATDTFHALPLRRSSLMLTHLAAGMTILALPMILCFGVVFVTGSIYGARIGFDAGALLFELLVWLIASFANLVVALFVGVFVGTCFDHIVFALGLNCVLPVVIFFTEGLLSSCIRGHISDLGPWVFTLSPISYLFFRFMTPGEPYILATFNWAALVWVLVGAALVWLTLWLYRRRKSELAGATGRANPLTLTLKLAATYVCGGLMGLIFESIFYDASRAVFFPLGCLIGTCTTFILFEAVVARGFSTFKRNLPLLGGCIGVMAVVSIFYCTGGFGLENMVPSTQAISSITMPYEGRYSDLVKVPAGYDWEESYPSSSLERTVTLRSPEAKELVTELHRQTISHQQAIEAGAVVDEVNEPVHIEVEYKLFGFLPYKRYYYQTNSQGLALYWQLQDLEEYRRQSHPVFELSAQDMQGAVVSSRTFTESQSMALSESEMEELLQAARQDLLELPLSAMQQENQQAECVLEFTLKPHTGVGYDSCYLMVLPEYTNTLQQLAALGYPADALAPDTEGMTAALYYSYQFGGLNYSMLGGAYMGPFRKGEEGGYFLTEQRARYTDTLLVIKDSDLLQGLLEASYNTDSGFHSYYGEAEELENGILLEPVYQVVFAKDGKTRNIPLRLVVDQLSPEEQEQLGQLLHAQQEATDLLAAKG